MGFIKTKKQKTNKPHTHKKKKNDYFGGIITSQPSQQPGQYD